MFYGVPVSELLPDPRPSSAVTSSSKIVLNLESLGSLPADEAGPLARYASTIQAQRHDYNGKVLSIRAEDLKSLAIIYDMSPDELTQIAWECRRDWNRPGTIFKRMWDFKTHMSSPYRLALFLMYNPIYGREAYRKNGMWFGYKKNSLQSDNTLAEAPRAHKTG